jgi:hypothetical protein
MRTVIRDLSHMEDDLDLTVMPDNPEHHENWKNLNKANIQKGDIIFFRCNMLVIGISYNLPHNTRIVYTTSAIGMPTAEEYFKGIVRKTFIRDGLSEEGIDE